MSDEKVSVTMRVTDCSTVCRFCKRRSAQGESMYRVLAMDSRFPGRGYYCTFIFDKLKALAAAEVEGIEGDKKSRAAQLGALLLGSGEGLLADDFSAAKQDITVQVAPELLTQGDLLRTFWPEDEDECVRLIAECEAARKAGS